MYPGSLATATGGTLAATGLAVGGYLWAAAIVLALGILLVMLGVARDRAIARRAHAPH